MVVDTSAIIALLTERDGERYARCASEADTVAMSAVNTYETRIVLSGRRGVPRFPAEVLDRFERWLLELEVEIVPFDADQAILAHAAHALSRSRGEPLLSKGEDFARTDIEPALGAAS